MKDIKVAVVGTGHLGSIHTKLWKENKNTKLMGIYDTDKDKALELSIKFDCKNFATLEDTIANVDAVTIAVPTNLHFAVAEKFIKAGKHCLIEKPITATNEEATKLIELAKQNNVMIQVGHVERFNPAIASLYGFELNPMFIEAHRLSQFKPRATDVSVVHDLMIHDIDIMLWLVRSKVKSIDANGVSILTETPDIANARITFENGCVANLTASRISAHPMRKMRMFQQNAYISIDFGKPEVELFQIKEDGENAFQGEIPAAMLGSIESGHKNKNIFYSKPEMKEINAIAEEQIAFSNAISNGLPVPVGAEEAAEALRIAEEISDLIK